MGWVVGFEPTHVGITILCLNRLTTPTMLHMIVSHLHTECKEKKLATKTRLELVTSSVTGWHSNQLNYLAAIGGRYRARTCDLLLVRQMLSQLS